MRPRACSNATRFESNAGPPRPLRLRIPLALFPILIDLFATLLLARIRPVRLPREFIPLHKLTLDVPGVLRIVHLLRDPDNGHGRSACASARPVTRESAAPPMYCATTPTAAGVAS